MMETPLKFKTTPMVRMIRPARQVIRCAEKPVPFTFLYLTLIAFPVQGEWSILKWRWCFGFYRWCF